MNEARRDDRRFGLVPFMAIRVLALLLGDSRSSRLPSVEPWIRDEGVPIRRNRRTGCTDGLRTVTTPAPLTRTSPHQRCLCDSEFHGGHLLKHRHKIRTNCPSSSTLCRAGCGPAAGESHGTSKIKVFNASKAKIGEMESEGDANFPIGRMGTWEFGGICPEEYIWRGQVPGQRSC